MSGPPRYPASRAGDVGAGVAVISRVESLLAYPIFAYKNLNLYFPAAKLVPSIVKSGPGEGGVVEMRISDPNLFPLVSTR